ncbi:MAG: hypothetical protein WC856_02700 [Methylococcaceae bacterium]|jgi:hypothetical protein
MNISVFTAAMAFTVAGIMAKDVSTWAMATGLIFLAIGLKEK